MKHKLLFLLASLLLPLAASAYDACIDGIYYNIVKKAKQATVTYGESTSGTYSGKVVIPATVEYDGVTCDVIAIGKNAFLNSTLTSLTIPSSIKSIEINAFYGNYGRNINQLHINDLAAWCKIQIIDNDEGLGDNNPIAWAEHLYVNGKEVKDLVIPDGVTKVNDNAFYGAKMLNTITIPGSVTVIGSYSFCCENHDYSKVIIDNKNLVSIGKGAFNYSSSSDHHFITELHITDLAAWYRNIKFHDEQILLNKGVYSYNNNNPLTTADKFFVNDKEISDLVVPDGVITIVPFAFYRAKMLKSVSIPNSVKEIGKAAFSGCTSLKNANIPDEVQVIDGSFSGCNSLKDLTIGCGLKTMTGVLELENLENIYISDLTAYCRLNCGAGYSSSSDPFVRIPMHSPMRAYNKVAKTRLFLNGNEVKNLVIPSDYFDDQIDYSKEYYICQPFYGITSLTSVTIPQEVVKNGMMDCAIRCTTFNCSYCGFKNCPNLKSIKNETYLTEFQIENNEKLESLSLGKYTKYCEVNNCKELADVYCAGMPFIAWFGEECHVEYATLHVPEMLIDRYRNFSNNYSRKSWKDFGSIIALKPGDPGYVANPDNTPITFADAAFGTVAIANWDFNGDGKLSKYEASLVTDFDEAFKGNTNIKTLDDLQYFTSMLTINNSAFYGCSGITSVTIPSFITSIGERAFQNCSKMTSVTIPKSVKFIGKLAFGWCNLTAVQISDLAEWCKMTVDGDVGFEKCHLYLNGKEITDLVIPSNIIHIKDYNFRGFTGLTSVIIPNNVKSIGKSAFYKCTGLTSVTIPNSVTAIGIQAFYGCDNLNAIDISDLASWCGIEFIALQTYYGENEYSSNPLYNRGCLYLNGNKVTNLVIPSSVTSISAGAFYNCCGLASVTIPNSVTSIGEKAFSKREDLIEVHSMIKRPFAIDENVFQCYTNDNKFTSAILYVPHGTKEKYQSTDGWKNFTTIIETDFADEPKGDVNADGTVDVADIATVISVMTKGGTDLTADVNGDGVVDVADIASIISEMAARARMLNEAEE